MIKNPFFANLIMDGENYLAPFGSASANGQAPVMVDKTLAKEWEMSGESLEQYEDLLPKRLIKSSKADIYEERSSIVKALIANLLIDIFDHTGGVGMGLKDFFRDFIYTEDIADSISDRDLDNEGKIPDTHEIHLVWSKDYFDSSMNLLLTDDELSVFEDETSYYLSFHVFTCVKRMIVDKDLKHSIIYLKRTSDSLNEELQMAIRNSFSLIQLMKGRVFLHSASINYKDKVWCFSASSGTGKSTHTRMWIEEGCKSVNGDLNLLGIEGNQAVIYGTPWCGTSGQYTVEKFPLGGIVLLKRNSCDKAYKKTEHKSISVLARIISPMWNEEMLKMNADIVQKVCDRVEVATLECTKEKSAYLEMKSYIDSL